MQSNLGMSDIDELCIFLNVNSYADDCFLSQNSYRVIIGKKSPRLNSDRCRKRLRVVFVFNNWIHSSTFKYMLYISISLNKFWFINLSANARWSLRIFKFILDPIFQCYLILRCLFPVKDSYRVIICKLTRNRGTKGGIKGISV